MKPRRAWLLAAAFAAVLPAGVAAADGEIRPGAYCPLPKRGEKPKCLEPAVAEYGDFFHAIDEGAADDGRLVQVESDLAAGGDSENAYLALSSLAYGYYQLSRQAARTPEADPAIAARLERWNGLLGQAYEGSAEDDDFRGAVREAALDLRRNAPPVTLVCLDEQGEEVACESTDAVVRGLDAAAGDVGYRGGLERLLERILGEQDS